MIGRALVEGVIKRSILKPQDIVVTARHQESRKRVADLGVRFTRNNREAVAQADIVVLAVPPDQAVASLLECREQFRPGHLLVSVVTGVPTQELEAAAGPDVAVVRAVPNIAMIVEASVTSIAPGRRATARQVAVTRRIFESVGAALILDERHLDACTGLAGCGPAFAFKVIESLAEGGVKMGLPRDAARTMAAWVLLGAAQLVLKTGRHPAELKDEVTTPGGCTIDGIAALEERGLPIALIAAVETSSRKASRLRLRHNGPPVGHSQE